MEAIRFELHIFLLTGFLIEHIPFAIPNIPHDGNFHPVQGHVPFEPNFFPDNNVQDVYFAITKFADGPICIDDIEVFVGPPPLNIDANLIGNSGPQRGGTEVRIQGEGVGEFDFVRFGNRGAAIIGRDPDELRVLSPPSTIAGPVDVYLVNGQDILLDDPFTYNPPPHIGGLEPGILNPSHPDTLILHGRNFNPDDDVLIGDRVIPPDDVTVGIELVSLDLTSVQPFEVGFHDVSIRDSGGGIFNAAHSVQIGNRPLITEIQPSTGHTSGGGFFELHGQNLNQCGVTVTFNNQPPVGIQHHSDTLITGFTPPGDPGPATVDLFVGIDLVDSKAGIFSFDEGPTPGDANVDGQITFSDLKITRNAIFPGGDSSGINLSVGDINGDGVIDLIDNREILNAAANPNQLGFPDPETASISLQNCNPGIEEGVTVNSEVSITVKNIGSSIPAMIDLGNGFAHNIQYDGTYKFSFDSPGIHEVTLISDDGPVDLESINVLPEDPVQISSIDLSIGDTGERMMQLEEGEDPPDLMATVTATGSGMVNVAVHHDSDVENADVSVPMSFEVPTAPAGEKTVEVNLGPAVVTPGSQHTVSVEVHSGAGTTTPEAAAPLPISIQITGFVTPGDCEEILRNWRSLVAQKKAKKADCEALQKQLDKLKEDLAGKEAEKPNKEQDLADCKEQRNDLQEEIDDILDTMNAFMPPGAMAQTYMSGEDFPPGSQYAGSKRNGSATGVGISFADGNQALDAIDNYESATGRDYSEDLARMRQNIKDIENLDTKIMNKETELNDLNGEIDDLKNTKIPGKEKEVADCTGECDTLETQIENYAAAHKECLEQLEKQRKAQGAINNTERQGTRAQNQADRSGNSADNAEDIVDGRAGSPGQIAGDKADIATGKSCKEQAQDLINQGNALNRQARAALAGGDTETATNLAAQAAEKYDQAKIKLEEGNTLINDARSRALGRKRRDCPVECEGLAEITEERYCVFTSLDDVSIVLFGYTPETWASFDAAAKEAIDGLDTVSDIQSAGGDYSPIAGATVSDVGEVATAIYNAFANNLAGSVAGWNVWIKHSGHIQIKRTIRRCVNGCWELEKIEHIDTDETCMESRKLPGTVQPQSGNIEDQIKAKLNRYRNTLRPKRSGPPTTTKEQQQ